MTGKTYIDGLDLYTEFGIFISDGGYNGIVCFHPLKEIKFNDWHEEDGIEVDLSDPKLNINSVDIGFAAINFKKISKFLEYLSDGAYHEFNFTEIMLTRTLRLQSSPNVKILINIGNFSLQFYDDFPLDGFVPDVKTPGTKKADFEIDGLDLLASYGVNVLEGLPDVLSTSPDVKENLLINISNENGAYYDSEEVIFREKELNVRCLYLAKLEDNGRYWYQDYYNLLNALVQPGERELNIDLVGLEYAYYKAATVERCAVINGKIWIEFTLNMVFTSFRPSYDEIIILEDEYIFETEDEYAINLE